MNNELNNENFGGEAQNVATEVTSNESQAQNQTYVTYIPYGLTPETFEERKKIKKSALTIGLALIIMSVISWLFSVSIGIILTSIGISSANVYKFLQDPAANQVFQIMVSSLIFTIPYIFIFKTAGFNISELVPLAKPKKQSVLPLFLIGISFCSFANILVSLAGNVFSNLGIDYEVNFGENPQGVFGFLLSFLATVAVPALVEEFACRGLILGSLRKFGEGFAIFTSSIIFGVMHGNFEQMPFAFLVGLVLAFITVKSGTLWIAVAVHAFNNFASVFFKYAFVGVSRDIQNAVYTIFLTICLALGVFAIYLLKDNDDKFKLSKANTVCTEKQKYKWFFTGFAIVIFMVESFLKALSFFK